MIIIEISQIQFNEIIENITSSITIDFEEIYESEICLKCKSKELHCKIVDVKYSSRHTLITFINHLAMF